MKKTTAKKISKSISDLMEGATVGILAVLADVVSVAGYRVTGFFFFALAAIIVSDMALTSSVLGKALKSRLE